MNVQQVKLGLSANWRQFTLLVIVNAFVGGMIGMERSILPQFAELEFGIASKTAILSFITAFGFSKAIANYYTGKLANLLGRKNLLILGWILAIPIPFMLMLAPSWNWVIVANILLGISQGLTWSSTVVMKIDLVGEKDRGFAMGLNEFAGYFSVGLVAFLSGYIANKYGVSPYPFIIGIFISIIGLVLSIVWVKDTSTFVKKENKSNNLSPSKNVFIDTTFRNKTLSSVTQAGLVNNLNDGMIWGLLPIVLLRLNYNIENIGAITAIYPTVWGLSQLLTGKMADHYSKKNMLFWGMLLQGIAIIFLPFSTEEYEFICISIVLGFGTALVYPTFLTSIASATTATQRAESIGTFRLWRDLGYAIGALISGITADVFGLQYAIILIAVITILSAVIIKIRMPENIESIKECINIDEVQKEIEQHKNIQIIDVRSKEEFEQAHIPIAINISLNELKDKTCFLDKNIEYITACGKGGGRSTEASKLLKEYGFKSYWLCGGTYKWLNIEN
jgi:MFS family permease/rhodanese-related sulfurtransferase